MGMYTELLLKVDVAPRDDVELEVLRFLFADGPMPEALPGHEFFEQTRWTQIGNSCSYYHHPRALSDLHEDRVSGAPPMLFSRSDLKNYGNEILHFLDWLHPMVHEYSRGQCIGWIWYEEHARPSLILCGSSGQLEVKWDEEYR